MPVAGERPRDPLPLVAVVVPPSGLTVGVGRVASACKAGRPSLVQLAMVAGCRAWAAGRDVELNVPAPVDDDLQSLPPARRWSVPVVSHTPLTVVGGGEPAARSSRLTLQVAPPTHWKQVGGLLPHPGGAGGAAAVDIALRLAVEDACPCTSGGGGRCPGLALLVTVDAHTPLWQSLFAGRHGLVGRAGPPQVPAAAVEVGLEGRFFLLSPQLGRHAGRRRLPPPGAGLIERADVRFAQSSLLVAADAGGRSSSAWPPDIGPKRPPVEGRAGHRSVVMVTLPTAAPASCW